MHHYHHRAFYTGVGCVVVIVAGLLALNFPVFLDAFDRYGFQIKCGTGLGADLSQAAAAGEHTYVDQCEQAVLVRRLWTIPPVVIASTVLALLVVAAALFWGRESAFGKDPVA